MFSARSEKKDVFISHHSGYWVAKVLLVNRFCDNTKLVLSSSTKPEIRWL